MTNVQTHDDLATMLQALVTAEVRRQLDQLEQLTVRRLVVVDQHGVERIVASAGETTDNAASVRVQDPSGEHYVELVNVAEDVETAFSEVTISCAGTQAATLYAMPTNVATPGHDHTAALVLDDVTMLQRFWKAPK